MENIPPEHVTPGRSSSLEELRNTRQALHKRLSMRQRLLYTLVSVAIFMPILAASLLLLLYAVIPVTIIPLARQRVKEVDEQIQDLGFEIDLRQFEVSPRESRAENMIRISNIQLRRYYDLNLTQNVWVFGLGVFCIILGVGVIGVTIYLLLKVAEGIDSKIITGAVGTVGSLLVNYVAAIYLKMHSNASSNHDLFHSRLVETHQMLLGNLLASRIENDEKRWETISFLSKNIAKK
jgi:hypothetical protein